MKWWRYKRKYSEQKFSNYNKNVKNIILSTSPILDIEIKKYYLKYMAKSSKCFLLVLLIILLFSCKKSDNNAVNAEVSKAILEKAEENRIAREKKEEQDRLDTLEFYKKLEDNDTIAAEIALEFADRRAYGGTGGYYSSSKPENISSIDVIIKAQGYYIQQLDDYFLYRRAPEILVLSVKDENVYIKEIDLVKGQIITRKEILLQFDGKTFAHNRTKLETQDGKIQIAYLEHISNQPWRDTFEYRSLYTFAGNLDDPINEEVRKLTSDYLETFTGMYVFDSCKLIESSRKNFDLLPMRNTYIQILYNQKLKCLTVSFSTSFYNNYSANDFVDTDNERIIYWIAGEGAGYTDDRFYFYKGGIAHTRDHSSYIMTDDGPSDSKYEKYVVFYRKKT